LETMMTTRPCWVEIRTRLFEENYRFLQTLAAPHAELLAIVKADAYGHSLALCAPAAVRAGAHWLGVTSVEEGVATRALCPGARILVIGGAFPGQGAAVVEHNLTAVAWDQAQLDELESAAQAADAAAGSVAVHLEIDTGMSRQGIAPALLEPDAHETGALTAILDRFTPGSPLRLDGIMTHLFAADEAHSPATEAQLTRLDEAVGKIGAAGHLPDWFSVGASAALVAGQACRIAELASRHGMKALLRPGLALYGLAPEFDPPFTEDEPPSLTQARARLQPVLSWKTQVASVRQIPAGAVVGYNGTFVATEPMRLALVAAGYADGLDRHLGNHFSLLVRGQRAPLVGRVSMDQAIIDVTDIPGVEAGEEVVILGTQDSETISAFEHAKVTGTIPWEVFTRIGQRVRRVEV
jgi:alanine racemase